MPYPSETIKTVIDRLNVQYFLPAIQRHYVWKPVQIVRLFDSIMQGYPISSFLFWEINSDNRDKWEIYKFNDHATYPETGHLKASADGVQQLTVVLDGQQRLTSLLIGLRGRYTQKLKYRRRADPNAYHDYYLYLDLFKDPRALGGQEDSGKSVYAFSFVRDLPTNDASHHWIKVGRILDCYDQFAFFDLRKEEEDSFAPGVTKEQENVFEMNLARLYDAIWRDPAIAFYVERGQDYDRVLTIFVRANDAGTPLSKAQILMAMVTSKWTKVQAKEQIVKLISYINSSLPKRNNLNIDFVMRVCLVLSDLPVRYMVGNFTNDNLSLIEDRWDKITDAIERGYRLVNAFGLDRNNMRSRNALIPILYYLFQNPGISLLGTTPFECENFDRIRRWLMMALLNNVFARSADQVLSNTRRVLKDHASEPDFPDVSLNKELSRMGFSTGLDDSFFQRVLGVTYSGSSFFVLSLLYADHPWVFTPQEQDHIFPKSASALQAMSDDEKEHYRSLVNRIGNLQLLNQEENNEKRNKPFEKWLPSRDPHFRKKHLIPEDNSLLKVERFEDFIRAREDLIVDRLKKVIFTEDSA